MDSRSKRVITNVGLVRFSTGFLLMERVCAGSKKGWKQQGSERPRGDGRVRERERDFRGEKHVYVYFHQSMLFSAEKNKRWLWNIKLLPGLRRDRKCSAWEFQAFTLEGRTKARCTVTKNHTHKWRLYTNNEHCTQITVIYKCLNHTHKW